MDSVFKCPVCSKPLEKSKKIYSCGSHTFDIAKEGYVNLILNAKETSGDSKEMMQSRRDFLNLHFYRKLVECFEDILYKTMALTQGAVLDIGCGEGYYLDEMQRSDHPAEVEFYGLEISKMGTKMAAKRNRNVHWVTANSADLPFLDHSMDAILSIFSIYTSKEVLRVMKDDGVMIIVRAGEDHLLELRNIIYPEIIEKPKSAIYDEDLFRCISCDTLKYQVHMDRSEDIMNLLYMTPHYWKIKQENKVLLTQMDALDITIDFQVIVIKCLKNFSTT